MRRLLVAGLGLCALAGCNRDLPAAAGPRDLSFAFPEFDLAGLGILGEDAGPNPCGDVTGICQEKWLGPEEGIPFPLEGDQPQDPNETDNGGVSRDKNGWLGLSSTTRSLGYLWLANTDDWGRGTITKLDSQAVREAARYPSVTCNSSKAGSKLPCDGLNGCCARDSNPEWVARKNKQPTPGHQQVQLMANNPSRTAVDWNGDAWVSNRAFGGQSSVTKIADGVSDCIDRNGNGKIDTSDDVNNDGVIQTDCNGNSVPDDLDDVKQMPCTNGFSQEYFGLDDECVLFTTNTNVPNSIGRPLGLGQGKNMIGPSDAWPGSFADGKFFRIDGTSGLTIDETQVMDSRYGVAIDGAGIAWAGPLGGGKVCYFDTNHPTMTGCARDPDAGEMSGYGITLDRDQNVWWASFGPDVFRYTPDRGNGFAGLGNGTWTTFKSVGGKQTGGFTSTTGIAADARSPNAYFVWTNAGSWIVRIPASDIPLPNGADVVVDGSGYTAIPIAGGGGRGAGVDNQQNVWAVSISGSVATRIPVDVKGTPTLPDILSPGKGNNLCPAGDRCPYTDNMNSSPDPYTYSDFTGFGLRNFTRPAGSFEYVIKGCDDGSGSPTQRDTKWVRIDFIADVPTNTSLVVRARSGNTPWPDGTWGQWTAYTASTPGDLLGKLALQPNLATDGWLQVEVDLGSQAKNVSPKLKDLGVLFECAAPPG